MFCATTPMARDLTTHMGKGVTAQAARLSCLMEAVERLSAEAPPKPPTRASFSTLGNSDCAALDPRCLSPNQFDADQTLSWLPGNDLRTGSRVMLPADMCLSPPVDGLIRVPDTNGLASGNTRTEALIHALCEVIERDCAGRHAFADLYGEADDPFPRPRHIDPGTLPKSVAPMATRIVDAGLMLSVEDLTGDVAVPVLRATINDHRFPTESGPDLRIFPGLGCDPNAHVAVSRAITEAAQSRLAIIQGARDSFNRRPAAQRTETQARRAEILNPPTLVDFATVASTRFEDILDELDHVLRALDAAGFDSAFFTDLTRADIGIPVVRAIVPGLSLFLVDPSRFGTRDLACLA